MPDQSKGSVQGLSVDAKGNRRSVQLLLALVPAFTNVPLLLEAHEPPLPDDDMVEQGYSHDLPRLPHPRGHLDVLVAGGGVSGGVVVDEDDCRAGKINRVPVDVPGVGDAAVQGAYGDGALVHEPVLHVKVCSHEVFLVEIPHPRHEVRGDVLGGAYRGPERPPLAVEPRA